MDEVLKPCPFCGARLVKSEAFSTRSTDFFVHEPPEVAAYDMCPLVDYRVTGRDADRITAWNRRAPDPRQRELEEALRGMVENFAPPVAAWNDTLKAERDAHARAVEALVSSHQGEEIIE